MAEAVWLRNSRGTWELCGADRLPGVVPDSFVCGSNARGPDTCSFQLKRSLEAPAPDLAPFTDCEVWDEGTMIFEGRVQETPMSRGEDGDRIQVNGRGFQYSLEDDVFERTFVAAKMSEWVDSRSLPFANLGIILTSGTVNNEDGAIQFGYAKGASYSNAQYVGITLDAKSPMIRAFSFDVYRLVSTTAFSVYVRGHQAGDPTISAVVDGYEDAVANLNYSNLTGDPNAPTRLSGSFSVPYRYVTLFLYNPSGTSGDTGADHMVCCKGLRVASDSAYLDLASTGQSLLKASEVVTRALEYAPMLSKDRSQIAATSFSIPDFAATEPKNPSEYVDAVNAFHRWAFMVGREKVPIYRPQRSTPLLQVNPSGSGQFEDASANSGDDVYNKVIGVSTSPDSTPIRVVQGSANIPAFRQVTYNGNATWETFPNYPSPGQVVSSGTFALGVPISLPLAFWVNQSISSYGVTCRLELGNISGGDYGSVTWSDYGPAATSAEATWVPKASYTQVQWRVIYLGKTGSTSSYYDPISFQVFQGSTTSDRRGFARTKVLNASSAMGAEALTQICRAFLESHSKTPLKGSTIFGPGDLIDYRTGEPVHPRELMYLSNELINFPHLVDPDTGDLGRDGMLVGVGSYDPSTELASCNIDSSGDNLESLLNRYGVVTQK